MAAPEEAFLQCLAQALEEALASPGISTAVFVRACTALLPVFDKLGTVFNFAKAEFAQKNESLDRVANRYPTLKELVNEDKKRKTVTKKNSCSRNLHRLRSAILFVSTLVQRLVSDDSMTLRDAASIAYDSALAPIHTYVVRGAVRAGLMMLPTRAAFLSSICETETTARSHTEKLVAVANEMIAAIDSMYDVPMPSSNTWFISN